MCILVMNEVKMEEKAPPSGIKKDNNPKFHP
jgi:hypothetical protein